MPIERVPDSEHAYYLIAFDAMAANAPTGIWEAAACS